ncbi:hypothetical protein MAHJHV57_52250 [Mycobacterium avium subsp. hominissuis]
MQSGGPRHRNGRGRVPFELAAGLHTSRIDGSALAYNQPDPKLPDLVVCRPELAERILSWQQALL